MAKNPKTKRTQIQDLPVAEQELAAEEMEKVQGGTVTVRGWDPSTKQPVTSATTNTTATPASDAAMNSIRNMK